MLLEFTNGNKKISVYIEENAVPDEWQRDIDIKKSKSVYANAVLKIMRRNFQISDAAIENLKEEGFIRQNYNRFLDSIK